MVNSKLHSIAEYSSDKTDAGDVFYNVTLGDIGGMNYTVPGMCGDAGGVYDYSLVKVSAGVRF